MRHHLALLPLLCGMLSLSGFSQAQQSGGYPQKPIKIVIPVPPGGSVDGEIRIPVQQMVENTKWTMVIENQGGGGGAIGTGHVAKAAPDGYTILGTSGSFATMPALLKLPFDPIRDFTPLSLLSRRSNILVVSATLPFQSLKEYLAYAKANPGKLNFGTSGNGGPVHLAGAWLHQWTDTQVTFVHYKGFGGAFLVDLAAGRLGSTIGSMSTLGPHIKSGKLRLLGISGGTRSRVVPDMPTIAEQGVPGYNYINWAGVLGPAGLSPQIVKTLVDEFSRAAKHPSIVKRIESLNGEAVGSSSEEFGQFIRKEIEVWQKLVGETGIQAD